MPEKTERAVQATLARKDRPGLRKIAASLGIGVGTVQRISAEMQIPFAESAAWGGSTETSED
jgi:hypothetical protein